MSYAFEITPDDVANVLNLPLDDDRVYACFNALNGDFGTIEKAALHGDDMSEQIVYAYESIQEILKAKGYEIKGRNRGRILK